MAACPLSDNCVFLERQLADLPGMAELIRTQYCLGDYQQCARRMVQSAMGEESVPPNLYPSQVKEARRLLGLD